MAIRLFDLVIWNGIICHYHIIAGIADINQVYLADNEDIEKYKKVNKT